MNNVLRLFPSVLAFCLSFFPGGGLFAQEKRESLFNLLTKEEGAKITLETDLTTLLQNRKANAYFPASLTTADGVTRKVEIKPRGKYRRKICEFPPLKLKFSKKSLVAEGLDTLNEVKLVVPCFDNEKGDELIVKEYLIYKMYEKLTPVSVRARLVTMTLKDIHVEKSKRNFLALLVEDEEELAARLNVREFEKYGIEPDSLVLNQAALTVMFNFFVGNTDWEIAMMRNVRLLKSPDSDKVLTVPYDFDFSGFVAAPYSSPNSETGLKTVLDRFLMSSGLPPEALRKAAQKILANKKELLEICRTKLLSKSDQQRQIDYLELFFSRIESSEELPGLIKYEER